MLDNWPACRDVLLVDLHDVNEFLEPMAMIMHSNLRVKFINQTSAPI